MNDARVQPRGWYSEYIKSATLSLAPPSLVTHRRRHTTLVHVPRALAGLGRAQRNALGAAVSTLFLDYVQQLED